MQTEEYGATELRSVQPIRAAMQTALLKIDRKIGPNVVPLQSQHEQSY